MAREQGRICDQNKRVLLNVVGQGLGLDQKDGCLTSYVFLLLTPYFHPLYLFPFKVSPNLQCQGVPHPSLILKTFQKTPFGVLNQCRWIFIHCIWITSCKKSLTLPNFLGELENQIKCWMHSHRQKNEIQRRNQPTCEHWLRKCHGWYLNLTAPLLPWFVRPKIPTSNPPGDHASSVSSAG